MSDIVQQIVEEMAIVLMESVIVFLTSVALIAILNYVQEIVMEKECV